MIEFTRKSFELPEEVLEYPGARLERLRVRDLEAWRMVADPGWRYSDSMGPTEGTVLCQAEHRFWMITAGRFAVQMEDGETKEFGPGDVGTIPPGHEAWVVGSEAVVAFDIMVAERSEADPDTN